MKIVAECSLKIGRGGGEVSWHFWVAHTLTKLEWTTPLVFFTTLPSSSFKEFLIIMLWKEGGGWSRGGTHRAQGPTWSLIEPDACKAKKFVFEAWHPSNNFYVWMSGFSNYSWTSRKQPPKMQWPFTGGGCLQESNHRGPLPRRSLGTSTLWKIIYCLQYLSYTVCSSTLSLKFFVYSK